jgi:hypothetical protein
MKKTILGCIAFFTLSLALFTAAYQGPYQYALEVGMRWEPVFLSGFYPIEPVGGVLERWTQGTSVIHFDGIAQNIPYLLTLRLSGGARPEELQPVLVTVTANAQPVATLHVNGVASPYRVILDPSKLRWDEDLIVQLQSSTFVPAWSIDDSQDTRPLGVVFERARLEPFGPGPIIPPWRILLYLDAGLTLILFLLEGHSAFGSAVRRYAFVGSLSMLAAALFVLWRDLIAQPDFSPIFFLSILFTLFVIHISRVFAEPLNRARAVFVPRWQFSNSDFRCALVLFSIFFFVGVAIAFNSLQYPFFWDDLHLVRPFSPRELGQAFVSTYDMDQLETPGYRPGYVLFNHLRASMFGESVLAHRLFEIALCSGYLAIVGLTAIALGFRFWQALFGGILALATKNSWWNLVWITDGIRPYTGLVLAISVYLLILYLRRPSRWKLGLCILFAGVGLFTREEGLPIYLLIPAFGLMYLLIHSANETITSPRRSAVRFLSDLRHSRLYSRLPVIAALTLGLAIILLIYFALRATFVPGAPSQIRIDGWVQHIIWVLDPRGQVDDPLETIWFITLGLLMGVNLIWVSGLRRLQALFWLLCFVMAASPGAVATRANLLLYPITFFSLALVHIFTQIARVSRVATVTLSIILCIVFFDSVARSRIAQQAVHPLSLDYIQNNNNFVYGHYALAKIPNTRIVELKNEFARLGIGSQTDFERVYPMLRQDAITNQRFEPSDAKPFQPRIGVLDP